MSFNNKSFESDHRVECEEFQDQNQLTSDDQKTYRSLVKSFCRHTSGHGFVRVVDSHRRIQWIWVIIMILTFIGLIAHLIELLLRYYKYGINSSIYITSDNQLLQPDITICPNQRYFFYRNASVQSDLTSPYVLHVYPGTSFNELFNRYVRIWETIFVNGTQVKLARYSMMRPAYNAKLLRGNYDIIINLNFRNEKLPVKDLYLTPTFDSTICVTFRPKIRFFNSLSELDATVMMVNFFMVGDDDIFERKTRTVSEQQNIFDGSTAYLHYPNTIPNLETDGYLILRGDLKIISFSESKIIRQNVNNKCLVNPKTISIRGFGLLETNSYEYSQYLCINTMRSASIYQACNCRSEIFLCPSEIPNSVPFCHQIPLEFEKKINNSFLELNTLLSDPSIKRSFEILGQRQVCHENQLKLIDNEQFSLVCLPKCIDISYQFDTSSTRIERQQLKFRDILKNSFFDILPYVTAENRSVAVLNQSLSHAFNQNMKTTVSMLHFIPKRLTVDITEESLSYPIENLLSDIGGILGLYLGFSVMSMLEIVELCVQLFHLRCGQSKSKDI